MPTNPPPADPPAPTAAQREAAHSLSERVYTLVSPFLTGGQWAQMKPALDLAIAAAQATARREAAEGMRERAASVAARESVRIKHTSHRDGLGMGDQAREQVALDIAAAIRALPVEG